MLSEAYQLVATLQHGSNYCNFIAIFVALSCSADFKSERAFYSHLLFSDVARGASGGMRPGAQALGHNSTLFAIF